ncbi:hypothetical protein DPMN_092611 [Dreissena polymorpha]|uniref:Reverse transcriptase zinc-binding domain-containing protein n=1 Tax=Dreissena polymorpha TaxID=45954 RepID=A0A9D4L2S2_DREPO|nr:hypothetical protein DPMN_092611 [Dreissena polymorpha]
MASFQTVLTSNEGFDKDVHSHHRYLLFASSIYHITSNQINTLKGISLEPDEEIKLSLLADDATYFLNDNYDSFHNLIESLSLYGMTSGLKLNKSKCTVLRVGKLKQSNAQYKKEMKFNWTSDEATTKWKLFYQKILEKYGDSLLFECNISNTFLHEIANENIFLSDVLSAWSDVTHNLETKTSNWFERSIKYVDQLYDYRIKDFYSFDDICYIYGIPSNNFLKYYTLIKSIPIHIKSEINTNNTPCTQTTFVENILGRKNKSNKIFYTLQIKKPTENSKTRNKWQRNFQYKYIHRIIATNKYLFKCKLSNSNRCDFCGENIETIEHLFGECKHIQPFF